MNNEYHRPTSRKPNTVSQHFRKQKGRGRSLFDTVSFYIFVCMGIFIISSVFLHDLPRGARINLFYEVRNQNKEIELLSEKEKRRIFDDRSGEGNSGVKQHTDDIITEGSEDWRRASEYDIYRIANAVAFAETSGGTRGSAISHNNAFGIMTWENGYRELKRYDNIGDSYEDFRTIWTKYYGELPNERLAKKWVCGGSSTECLASKDWLINFYYYY